MTRLSVNIPVIETERLILREPRATDIDALEAFYASDRSKFVGGPMDRFGAGRALSASLGHWVLNGFGFWTLTTQDNTVPLGRVGFLYPHGWPEVELGWQIFEGAEGKGYAFEAAQAIRRYGAAKMGITAPFSYVAKTNVRSRALAERLGAHIEREGDVLGTPCDIYRHARIEETV